MEPFCILGQVLVGWLFADFLSGLGHWFEDEIAEEEWPIIGKHVTGPNRRHHTEPLVFLESGFFGRHGITWGITAAVGACLIWAFGWQPWVLSAIVGGLFINEVHAWAHKPKEAPRIAQILQRTGIIQSPQMHSKHHRHEHNTDYCILTNWLNPVLDGIGFWRGIERLTGKATK